VKENLCCGVNCLVGVIFSLLFFYGAADAINYNLCPLFLVLFMDILVLAYVNWRKPLQTSPKIAYLCYKYKGFSDMTEAWHDGYISIYVYIQDCACCTSLMCRKKHNA
jgi:hypothetical protein